MEENKFRWLVLPVLLLITWCANAQDHRFMVFFQDKNSSFSIENPSEFLSQRAIARRIKQNIQITEEDLPVNSSYPAALESTGALVYYTTKWLNGALIQTDSSKLTDILSLPFVTSAELVAPGPLPTVVEVPGKQIKGVIEGRVQSTEIQNSLLGIDQMHLEGNTGQGMLIAVFDGGFMGVDEIAAFGHLYQNNQVITTFDYVGNSSDVYRYGDHGTQVLSVMGARSEDVFTGSAYDAEFILCVTEDMFVEYRVEEYNWLFAAEMADSIGVDIISTSLGYSEFDDPAMDYSPQTLDGMTTAISKSAKIAASKGIVLTISAGNEGNSGWSTITAPADVADALAVGAINEDTVIASFSSTGPTADGRVKPDVVALGVRTAVINRNGNLLFNNGTSFSAPQIAGLAAGVWQSNPDFDYLEVIQAIREAGHHSQNPNNQTGHGIPHFLGTKTLVLSVDDPEDLWFLKLYPNPVGDKIFVLTQVPLSTITLFIHNIQGQIYFEDQIDNIPALTELSLELPQLPGGIYLLTALTEDTAGTYRLIKE